jgi:hypothetical protein
MSLSRVLYELYTRRGFRNIAIKRNLQNYYKFGNIFVLFDMDSPVYYKYKLYSSIKEYGWWENHQLWL